MRTVKRKILSDVRQTVRVNGVQLINARIITWCIPVSETSRTFRVNHVAVSYYINGRFKGIDARYYKNKPVSINKKNPLESKIFVERGLHNYMVDDAFNDAYRGYVTSLTNLTGEVLFFDRRSGEGMIRIPELGTTVMVYACNLKGKKTWYPETACVYLDEGQKVTIARLGEVDRGVTPIINDGVHFDAEKWASLDHSRLAFKCDEDGNAINGLFG